MLLLAINRADIHEQRKRTPGTPQDWNISIVPDSGTGELCGISGKTEISFGGGKHSYVFDYTLAEKE